MTGSARVKNLSILQGSPIYLDANGNAGLATNDFTAFAVATDGAPVGGVVTYSTDGEVERSDWTQIAGSKFLTTGSFYYLSGTGKLSISGNQQIGSAKSKTVLAIQILQSVEPVIQVHTFRGKPPASMGKVGDLLIDEVSLSLMKKSHYGWRTMGRFVQSDVIGPIQMVRNTSTGGWGAYFSAT